MQLPAGKPYESADYDCVHAVGVSYNNYPKKIDALWRMKDFKQRN